MLTISESAAEVIKMILAGGDSPEGSGLRISPSADNSEADSLTAAISSAPAADDEVVEESGAKVFLDPQAASLLGGKVLDAEQDDDGEIGLAVRD